MSASRTNVTGRRLIAACRSIAVAAFILAAGVAKPAAAAELPHNDYPTAARADYVFACMQVNGQTRENLQKCSCSIDVIAELLPYEKYEAAETVMSVIQKGGESVSILHSPLFQEKVKVLKRAQVEGELRCF